MASHLPSGTDFSQLTQPIELGTPGVLQIVKCLSSGSSEVRDLLLYECDVIFECRVCRSMFRGLPNFLAHKRSYCMKPFKDKNVEFLGERVDESVMVVHPVDPDAEVEEANRQKMKHQNAVEKSLQRCFTSKPQPIPLPININPMESVLKPKSDQIQLTLTPIPGTQAAVFQEAQGLPSSSAAFSSKSEASKKSKSSDKSPQVIQAKSKDPHVISTMRKKHLKKYDYMDLDKMTCTLCNHTYSSLKSLYHHARTQHNSTRTFFPCLFCNSAFTAVWGVTRHMERIHNKTRIQVDKLKEKIKSKGFQRKVKPITKPPSVPTEPKKDTTPVVALSNIVVNDSKPIDITAQTMKLPTINVADLQKKDMELLKSSRFTADSKVPASAPPSTSTSPNDSVDRVVHVVPVINSVNTSPVAMTVKRQLSNTTEDAPAPKKGKLSQVVNSLSKTLPIETSSVTSMKKTMKNESGLAATESCSAPKSARQKLLEEMRRENENVASSGSAMGMFKCEICQKAFFKQDSYLRHVSYCVFDEDRIEAETSSARSRELNGKGGKSRDISPRGNTSNKSPPSKQTSDSKRVQKIRTSESEDVKVEKKSESEDRKTRSKTGSSTPKLLDHNYQADITTKSSPQVNRKDNMVVVTDEHVADRSFHYLDLNEEELKQVKEITDEKKMQCKKCSQIYSTVSSLHRHAIRHFGWRRFKCKLCSYAAFHKSECVSHLRRTHGAKVTNGGGNPDDFVLKLSPEQMNKSETKRLRVDKKNSPPSVNVVDMNYDSVRRRPPRLSPIKGDPGKVSILQAAKVYPQQKSKSMRKSAGLIKVMKTTSKSTVEPSEVNPTVKKKTDTVVIKQEIEDETSKVDVAKSESTASRKKNVASVSKDFNKDKSDVTQSAQNTPPLRGRQVVYRATPTTATPTTQQSVIKGTPNKVIVTPSKGAKAAMLRRAPIRANQPLVYAMGKNATKVSISPKTSVQQASACGSTRMRSASTSTSVSGVQKLQKAKFVNSRGGKTTGVYLLVVDEKKPAQTITPCTIASPSGSTNKLIVVKSSNSKNSVDSKANTNIMTVHQPMQKRKSTEQK